jgi:hypothetical protein
MKVTGTLPLFDFGRHLLVHPSHFLSQHLPPGLPPTNQGPWRSNLQIQFSRTRGAAPRTAFELRIVCPGLHGNVPTGSINPTGLGGSGDGTGAGGVVVSGRGGAGVASGGRTVVGELL